MTLISVLVLGFFLGMRHAVDADHVVAVSTIASRERSLKAAARVAGLWAVGHTLTFLCVGGVIIGWHVVVPPWLGLATEFCVALMLILLGVLNLRSSLRASTTPAAAAHGHGSVLHAHPRPAQGVRARGFARPLLVGVVHGLAGSAALSLLLLGMIRSTGWAFAYLVLFAIGTIAGMLLITVAVAAPIAATAHRFERLNVVLALVTGLGSLAFGLAIAYQIVAQGPFSAPLSQATQ